MNYFENITQEILSKIIEATEKELYLCLPSIHEEVKESILKLKELKKQVKINLLIDFDPQTFRQGYGEFKSFSKLFGEVDIKDLPDNRISFIISDTTGYFLFVESRSIVPANKQTLNAIKIDLIRQGRLKYHFFSSDFKNDINEEITNAFIEENRLIKETKDELIKASPALPIQITLEKYENVKNDLELNPPLRPDYSRIVEYYSDKFQYVDLNYHGQNIQHSTISIPSRILPYRNEEIKEKMKTKFKLFENIDKSEFFTQFKEIELEKKHISETYLTPLKCRPNKSVLKKREKNNFVADIESLKELLEKNKKNLYGAMSEEIKKSKQSLKKSLEDFLVDNPTDAMESMGPPNYKVIAENIANTLIEKLPFPDPIKIINDFKLNVTYSNLTYEDLRDEELIRELIDRKVIDEKDIEPLADFGKGISLL